MVSRQEFEDIAARQQEAAGRLAICVVLTTAFAILGMVMVQAPGILIGVVVLLCLSVLFIGAYTRAKARVDQVRLLLLYDEIAGQHAEGKTSPAD